MRQGSEGCMWLRLGKFCEDFQFLQPCIHVLIQERPRKILVSHRTAKVSHSLGGDLHAHSSEDLVRQVQQTVVDQENCLTTVCVVAIQLAHFLECSTTCVALLSARLQLSHQRATFVEPEDDPVSRSRSMALWPGRKRASKVDLPESCLQMRTAPHLQIQRVLLVGCSSSSGKWTVQGSCTGRCATRPSGLGN